METDKQRLKNPTSTFDKVFTGFLTWVEARIARYSHHGNPPVYDRKDFPWALEIESEWELIRKELDVLLQRREELPNFHDIAPDVSSITQDDHWKTFFLLGYGVNCEENQKLCPETTRILRKIPGLKTAMFSILSPGKHIPAHRGPYNGVLRYHLGLVVPEPKEQCRIRVDQEILNWNEGEGMIFDDAFDHEVWNDTDGVRVVLFVDFVRPVKFPINLINGLVLGTAAFTPYIREANDNQKKWEEQFHHKTVETS
ncbi:MAG: aspartyl/asparaginyl beta-hydroxylase domain-containing protein [Verrucomicrobiota bacterium]